MRKINLPPLTINSNKHLDPIKGILFDFDNTLTKSNIYLTYCMNESSKESFIHEGINTIDFLSDGSKYLNELLDLLDEKGISYGIATFGDKECVYKASEFSFRNRNGNPRFPLINIFSPKEFGGRDGSPLPDDKNSMIELFALRHHILPSNIMLIDDNKDNINSHIAKNNGIPMPFLLRNQGTGLSVNDISQLMSIIRKLNTSNTSSTVFSSPKSTRVHTPKHTYYYDKKIGLYYEPKIDTYFDPNLNMHYCYESTSGLYKNKKGHMICIY